MLFNSDPNFKRRNLTEWSLKYEQFASVSVSEQLHNHPSPTNINLLSVDYYWVRGGVGAQMLLYLHHRPSP